MKINAKVYFLLCIAILIRPALFADLNDFKTAMFDQDKTEIAKWPFKAYEIADKWYEDDEKDIALEFDHITVQTVQHYSYKATAIGDKWYQRGEIVIALEFDKLHLQKNSDDADTIADKWYNRGEKDIALEFDKQHLQYDSNDSPEIANKWFDRGEKDTAIHFGKLYPNAALIILDKLIESGNFVLAEEYANNMLEFWISQSEDEIQNNINDKLEFSIKIDSEYYYNILINNLNYINKDIESHNYLEFFKNLPLKLKHKDISITDYLTHQTYIDPEFLEAYNISIQEAQMMLELDIYELTKKKDIIFSILHAIALHKKEDPYFKTHFFYDNPSWSSGELVSNLKRLYLNELPLRSKCFKGILVHEWTHLLMKILFSNSEPYAKEDVSAKSHWDKTMELIWNNWNKLPKELKSSLDLFKSSCTNHSIDPYLLTISCFDSIKKFYDKEEYKEEAIARFVELIAMDAYEDPRVQEFLKPIYDYWMQYIKPAIEKYIAGHAKIDTFISDCERENILDPFYRAEIDSEYKNDLRLANGYPESREILGDKWYDRGQIDIAFEFDKLFLQKDPTNRLDIVNKWYKRGDKIRALKFDKIYLQDQPFMTPEIADEWFNRSEHKISLNLEKAYLKKILNKWDKRLYHDNPSQSTDSCPLKK